MNNIQSPPKFIIPLISAVSLSGSLFITASGYSQDALSGSPIGQRPLEETLARLKDIDAQLLELDKEENRLHELEIQTQKLKDKQDIESLIQQEQYFEQLEKQELKNLKEFQKRELDATKNRKKEEQVQEKVAQKQEKVAQKQEKAAQKQEKTFDAPAKKAPLIKLVDAETVFKRETDGEGQINQTIKTTAQLELKNSDNLSFTSGFKSYEQESVEIVTNIPVKIGWERKIGNFNVNANAGMDIYNRLDSVPSASLGVKHGASPKWLKSLSTSAEVEYAPYKFNAQTIENDIRYLRLKGSIFAGINKNTSFFTAAHAGILSDGNQEYQVFSRLERKLGKNFSLAGNLFAWGFADDVAIASGYFSPPNFLVYNAELGWEENITDFLNCRLSAAIGQQHVEGDTSQTNSLKGSCQVSISDDFEFDFGYTYSNAASGIDITGASSFSNSINGNLKYNY